MVKQPPFTKSFSCRLGIKMITNVNLKKTQIVLSQGNKMVKRSNIRCTSNDMPMRCRSGEGVVRRTISLLASRKRHLQVKIGHLQSSECHLHNSDYFIPTSSPNKEPLYDLHPWSIW